jgi:hypothetical protein
MAQKLSPVKSLNTYDWKRVAIHTLTYGGAVALVAFLNYIKTVDLGIYTSLVGLGIGVVADLVQRWIASNK